MNKMLTGAHRALHARPLVDVAYYSARVLQPLKDWYDDAVAMRNPISWEELQPWAGLNPVAFFTINSSSLCNARCVFCAYPHLVAGGFRGAIMPMGTFQKAVKEWEEIGGHSLNLSPTVGEVLVDPGFIDKLIFARSTRIPDIRFYTNGLNLHRDENWKKLVDARPNAVLISLGGCDQNSYLQSYGVNRYDDLILGIERFLEYDRSQGYPVEVTLAFRPVQSGWSLTGTADFQRVIRPHLGARVHYTLKADYDNWGGVITREMLPRPMCLRPSRRLLPLPCINLMYPSVLPDGTLRCCACRVRDSGVDELSIGNIHEESIVNLMGGPKHHKLVQNFYTFKRPAICMECSLYRPINRQWLKSFQSAAKGDL